MSPSSLNKYIRNTILSGICIGIGATVFLSSADKRIGAALFCIGLFTICNYGFLLFTGRIGYAVRLRREHGFFYYAGIWLGNLIGCAAVVIPMRFARPELSAAARTLAEAKLGQNLFQAIFLGMMCGVLMFIAVDLFARSESPLFKALAIFFGVVVFILCGFEHSIADICYMMFAVGANVGEIARATLYIIVVSLANAAGSIGFCSLVGKKEEK